MLIPRFSLRMLLAVTTVCAVFFYVVNLAGHRYAWAIAIVVAVSSVALTLVFHAIVFLLAWSLAQLGRLAMPRQQASSPFASATPPPQQIVPPEDPE